MSKKQTKFSCSLLFSDGTLEKKEVRVSRKKNPSIESAITAVMLKLKQELQKKIVGKESKKTENVHCTIKYKIIETPKDLRSYIVHTKHKQEIEL